MRNEAPAYGGTGRCFAIFRNTDASGSRRLVLTGELDMLAADDVRAAIASAVSADGTGVLIDLREATFMDSAGLRAILIGSADAARRGGGLTVQLGRGPVARLFELTGVTEQLDIREA